MDGAEDLPSDQPTVTPTATTPPPKDVVVPEETPYGPNRKVEPPEGTHPPDPEPAPSPGESATAPSGSGNSIEFPLHLFVPVFILLLVGCFGAGWLISPKGSTAPPTVDNPTNPPKEGEKEAVLTNMLPDLGLYSNQNNSTWRRAGQLIQARANQQIVVITHNPNQPQLLSMLRAKKNQTQIPISIITGIDTSREETEAAKTSGIPIYRSRHTLEHPYTIIILDGRIVIDASRNNWYWETSEPQIAEKIRKWAAAILEKATVE